MTSPRLAAQAHEDAPRLYGRTRSGPYTAPSITTVMGCLDEGMDWWAGLCAAEEAIEWAERIVEIKQMRSGKWPALRAAKDWCMSAADRDRTKRGAEGDLVHDYAEQVALHQIGRATTDDIQAAHAAAIAGGAGPLVSSFQRFWTDYEPTVLHPEMIVWGQTADGREYAGTTDLICTLTVNGQPRTVCLDYKGKRRLFKKNGAQAMDLSPKTAMQLCAAARASEIWMPGDAEDGSQDSWAPNPYTVEHALGVALAPDGYAVREYDAHNPLVWETFSALRVAFDFQQTKDALMSAQRLTGRDDLGAFTRAQATA